MQFDNKNPVHGPRAHLGSGTLGAKGNGDTFIGLNAQCDHIRLDPIVRRARKERLRRAFEMNGNLRQLP